MDELGNYIYLILLAIAGISSIFSRKRKPASVSTPTPPKKTWEEMMQELERTHQEIPNQEVLIQEPTWQPTEVTNSTVAPKSVSVVRLKSSSIKREMVAEEASIAASFDIQMNSIEDARRAFLYSEIFHRKY